MNFIEQWKYDMLPHNGEAVTTVWWESGIVEQGVPSPHINASMWVYINYAKYTSPQGLPAVAVASGFNVSTGDATRGLTVTGYYDAVDTGDGRYYCLQNAFIAGGDDPLTDCKLYIWVDLEDAAGNTFSIRSQWVEHLNNAVSTIFPLDPPPANPADLSYNCRSCSLVVLSSSINDYDCLGRFVGTNPDIVPPPPYAFENAIMLRATVDQLPSRVRYVKANDKVTSVVTAKRYRLTMRDVDALTMAEVEAVLSGGRVLLQTVQPNSPVGGVASDPVYLNRVLGVEDETFFAETQSCGVFDLDCELVADECYVNTCNSGLEGVTFGKPSARWAEVAEGEAALGVGLTEDGANYKLVGDEAIIGQLSDLKHSGAARIARLSCADWCVYFCVQNNFVGGGVDGILLSSRNYTTMFVPPEHEGAACNRWGAVDGVFGTLAVSHCRLLIYDVTAQVLVRASSAQHGSVVSFGELNDYWRFKGAIFKNCTLSVPLGLQHPQPNIDLVTISTITGASVTALTYAKLTVF